MRSLKKNIKLISHYHYGVVVYNFMYLNKWNIQSFLKGMCKDSHYIYMCVRVCKKNKKKIKKEKEKKRGIFKVYINLKTSDT